MAYLLKKYCDVDADKQYQLADWRLRPLGPQMARYAREDTHYLLYVYDQVSGRVHICCGRADWDLPICCVFLCHAITEWTLTTCSTSATSCGWSCCVDSRFTLRPLSPTPNR